MFKFVVLFALMCLATGAPAPGYLHGGYALPATSYSSRVDLIHSTPIIKAYHAPAVIAAPVITKSYVAPVVASYGGYGIGHGYGLGHGYGYGIGLEHGYGLH